MPASGDSNAATAKAKNTNPAAPLLPVSTLTQIAMARKRAVSPKSEKH